MTSSELMVARAYLGRVAEAGSLAVAAFVAERGPIEAARLVRRGAVPETVLAVTSARASLSNGEDDLAAGLRHGIRFVIPESPDWPHFAFAALYAAERRRLAEWRAGSRAGRYGGEPTVPLGLWVRGALPVEDIGVRSVALVGARAASPYGEQVATEFGYGLAGEGITVVSGGAFGIDAGAHRGALAAGGPTVIVSAGGLDRPYPSAHAALFEEVGATGLVVGENPPGCAPQRHRFLSRNRIIAALSAATVVIEAAARSGALNTAAHCSAMGRPLLAVPGPISSAMSVGCHRLISRPDNPAQLVASVEEVIDVVGGRLADGDREPARSGEARRSPYDDLDPTARAVLDGLPARSAAREDEISARSGVALPEVLRAITTLRIGGFVEAGRDGYRLVRRPA